MCAVVPLVSAGCQIASDPAATTEPTAMGTAEVAPMQNGGSGDSFTVVMSGDVLLHKPLLDSAAADAKAAPNSGTGGTAAGVSGKFDFRPLLAAQKPAIGGADLAVCQLETPLAPPNGPYTGYPSFSVPPDIVPALKDTGYDACTTASNHTLDKGFSGLQRTLGVLDAHGIKHTGAARSAQEAATPLIMDVRGVKVGLLNYAYGSNGPKPPGSREWSVNFMDADRIKADARKAKEAGANVVLVALHAGTEYQAKPDAQQTDMVKKITTSPDVDLVYGHHAHVVQPFDKVNGKWVAYGLGNTVARSGRSITGMQTREQIMSRFTFTRRDDGGYDVSKAEYIPGYMPPTNPFRYVDLQSALASDNLSSAKRREYEKALADIEKTVTMLGADKQGLTRGR